MPSFSEYLVHPREKLIPPGILYKVFNKNFLDRSYLSFIAAETIEELQDSIQRFKSIKSFNSLEREKLWYLIAFSHPNLDSKQFSILEKEIGITNDERDRIWAVYFAMLQKDEKAKQAIDAIASSASKKKLFIDLSFLGSLTLLQYMEETIPDEFTLAQAFQFAAQNNHLHVLKYLEKKYPNEFPMMIESGSYIAFRWAASNGHSKILKYLEKKALAKFPEMIAYRDYCVFWMAARNGHLHVLRYLEKKVPPDKFQEMIASNNFQAFQSAAANGKLRILKYLETKVSLDKFQEMIACHHFQAYQAAANSGLRALKYLEKKVTPNRLQEMIQAQNYSAFRIAVAKNHSKMVHHFLSFPSVFQFAIQHDMEFNAVLNSFLQKKLSKLRQQKLEDVDPETAQFLYDGLRYLIKQNNIEQYDDMVFLFNIPSVKEKASSEDNLLLRTAFERGNRKAFELLQEIPEIKAYVQNKRVQVWKQSFFSNVIEKKDSPPQDLNPKNRS